MSKNMEAFIRTSIVAFFFSFFGKALTLRIALTFGNSFVALKNYAYLRIALTLGSRLLSELNGICNAYK